MRRGPTRRASAHFTPRRPSAWSSGCVGHLLLIFCLFATNLQTRAHTLRQRTEQSVKQSDYLWSNGFVGHLLLISACSPSTSRRKRTLRRRTEQSVKQSDSLLSSSSRQGGLKMSERRAAQSVNRSGCFILDVSCWMLLLSERLQRRRLMTPLSARSYIVQHAQYSTLLHRAGAGEGARHARLRAARGADPAGIPGPGSLRGSRCGGLGEESRPRAWQGAAVVRCSLLSTPCCMGCYNSLHSELYPQAGRSNIMCPLSVCCLLSGIALVYITACACA